MTARTETNGTTLVPPAPAITSDPNRSKRNAAGAPGQSSEEPTSVTRVLVAESNSTIRKILRHAFTAQGWQMLEAEDGLQALEMAHAQPAPHAIILDINLAEMNGYEVCRTLKADDHLQLIPVVITTSLDNSEEKTLALDAGADDLLSKPIHRAELAVRLRSLLRIHRFNQELIGAESVAMALARAVAAKDGYAQSHLEKVATYAVGLGKAMGLDPTELKVLRYGAILHNVGKIAIPDAVLEKTGPLSPRESAMFQQHPRVGCDICAPLKPLKPVLSIIRHHKEHWDGTGYPDGLRGDEIPLGAQIVGIVDTYTALISDRPYRKAVSHEEAMRCLRQRADDGWHSPDIIERFFEHLQSEGRSTRLPEPDASESATPCEAAASVDR
ncbi:MAG: response regulator [Candidatus Nealsonbacteria bacterium]|nr:response regulator [Candidatus Nealsonbacteria bacterium]